MTRGKFLWLCFALLLLCRGITDAAEIFVRAKVIEPAGQRFKIGFGGHRHTDPWQFPDAMAESTGSQWTPWVDLSKWPWHGKLDRVGGVAEWPSMLVHVERLAGDGPAHGCRLRIQLADAPDEQHVVHDFVETSESTTIGFLVPHPLREHAAEFETGSQMGARHQAWARESTDGKRIELKEFTFCTSLWGPYDPVLARQDVQTLRQLGFNILGGADLELITQSGARTARQSWLYYADPEKEDHDWNEGEGRRLADALKSDEGRRELRSVAHWTIADEIRTLELKKVDATRRDGWFHSYLRAHGVSDADLGQGIDQVHYPASLLQQKSLARDASLPERRLLYHAAKFGQWWSARQLRHSSDLIHRSLPNMATETLPSDHGFFNAWGPPNIGMSAPMLDLFELASQQAVDQLSAEDWLGLNHMYGPEYTWTGAQSFEYLGAIMRSAIADRAIMLRGLITPSDDGYLRLKAYSALGQGAKSFFFWTYGPTYIGTENYWSDLKSQYQGIAKLGRALEQAEPVLYPAKPVRDPVAILYSVSHDLWHSDDPAAFVEKRLLWHALRHLQVQPDFLREEDVASGALAQYKALYVVDWCVSRSASRAIDQWVRQGGIAYLSAAAATRDEYYEPYVPPFVQNAWITGAAKRLKSERHTYNERTDLPTIKPMSRVTCGIAGKSFDLPVIGCRLDLRADVPDPLAKFDDGAPAAAVLPYAKGKVIALGFMPMLAYGQLAHFKATTLEENWPAEPREFARLPLDLAGITPLVRASEPVVEASLLSGPRGSALVLANYTYQPVKSLTIDLRLAHPGARAISTEGVPVQFDPIPGGVRLRLPLGWTDIVLLPGSL